MKLHHMATGTEFMVSQPVLLDGINFPSYFFQPEQARIDHGVEQVEMPVSPTPEEPVEPPEVTPEMLAQMLARARLSLREHANQLLQPSDWYLIRKLETGADVPTEISDYRAGVREWQDQLDIEMEEWDAQQFSQFVPIYEV